MVPFQRPVEKVAAEARRRTGKLQSGREPASLRQRLQLVRLFSKGFQGRKSLRLILFHPNGHARSKFFRSAARKGTGLVASIPHLPTTLGERLWAAWGDASSTGRADGSKGQPRALLTMMTSRLGSTRVASAYCISRGS